MAGAGTTADRPGTGTGDVPSIEQLAAIFPQFEIIELIGRGGMGFVFKARQFHLDREVALKLLPEKLGTDPHFAERFNREARVLARLNHPNIVMVHDFGHASGFYYLTMEYVEGLNLREAMRMGKFSPTEALAIVPKICDALQYAHEEGVLHRDIKPENILLDARGRVKIADFGIAKIIGEEKGALALTGTGASLGTPHYMAPEQFENPAQVDHRADIYSLGVVFYEMLTGELPLGRFSAPSARADMDERIDAIVLRALARERELRQKDARQFQTEVEGLATTGATLQAEGVPVAGSFLSRSWTAHRNKLAWIAATMVFLFLIFINLVQRGEQRRLRADYYSLQNRFQSPPPVVPEATLDYAATNDLLEDPEKPRREEEAIKLARDKYEQMQARHSKGEGTNLELARANLDLAVAEARGDALKIARANYDFAEWQFRQITSDRNQSVDVVWKGEQDWNEAHHAIELIKAGTNELQKAQAELKHAERALGGAWRHRDVRIEQNGIVTNFMSPEVLKKLENDLLYAQLRYKRIKQKEEGEN